MDKVIQNILDKNDDAQTLGQFAEKQERQEDIQLMFTIVAETLSRLRFTGRVLRSEDITYLCNNVNNESQVVKQKLSPDEIKELQTMLFFADEVISVPIEDANELGFHYAPANYKNISPEKCAIMGVEMILNLYGKAKLPDVISAALGYSMLPRSSCVKVVDLLRKCGIINWEVDPICKAKHECVQLADDYQKRIMDIFDNNLTEEEVQLAKDSQLDREYKFTNAIDALYRGELNENTKH